MKNKIFVGDNYEILNSNIMNEYINKIDMIYIDPPYNNGTKFSYENQSSDIEWENFIKKRIEISYKYMSEESAIFVSIDDYELAQLKTIMDEIFKKENFVGIFITKQSQRSNAKHINIIHEYVLCYAKNKKKLPEFKINRMDIPEDRSMIQNISEQVKVDFKNNGYDSAYKLLHKLIKQYCLSNNITWLRNYNNIDEDGRIYFAKDLSTPGEPREVNIPSINFHLEPLKTRGWPRDQKIVELYKNSRLVFKGDRPYVKHYIEEAQDSAPSILNFYSRQGTNALKKLGINNIFDTPKPVEMIKFFIRLCCKKDSIILDYFAGSGTTAQAVYEINMEDNRNNTYVLIQLNESVDKNTSVYNECLKLGIVPEVQYILKYRIDKFLSLNGKNVDYEFIMYRNQ